VRTKDGWIQGYNAQAAVNEAQIVIAAEVTVDSPDFGHLDPMVTAVEAELEAAGVTDTPDVVLADAGYWHQKQMEKIVSRGIQVLIPPDARKREGSRPDWNGGLYAFMRRVLDTDTGTDLYRKTQKGMIEPVFGHTKFNRRIDRYQRRGRSAARSEWRLITATHNPQKLHSHQQALANHPSELPGGPLNQSIATPPARSAQRTLYRHHPPHSQPPSTLTTPQTTAEKRQPLTQQPRWKSKHTVGRRLGWPDPLRSVRLV